MGFAIEINEVGPAEFPLMEVLRETVFGEFGFVTRTPIADRLSDRKDMLLLMAHLEGNPIGFSAGYQRTPHGYYINSVAVLRDYRHQGIGRELMAWKESFARSRGYERIEFNTPNRFPGMMRLGHKLGYRPIGLEQHIGTMHDLVIRFGKSLASQDLVDERLLAALERGDEIIGLVRDADSGQLNVLFRSETR
jgi:GNAT superfamily N-acetyltransferase